MKYFITILLLLIVVPAITRAQCATDLIISEYVEGSGNEKYIEIYNGTASSVNLTDYRLRLYANGAAAPTNDVVLSGTLNSGQVIVYRNTSATLYPAATVNAACNFNGDDAVVLYKISTASNVDIFGNIGCDPGAAWTNTNTTLDKSLVRNAAVTGGVTTDDGTSCPFPMLATQWTQYNIDDVSHLGSHTMNCTTPTIVVSPTSLSGFSYIFSAGPSASQTYTLSGTNLSPAAGNLTATAPTNYEVSLDNSSFSASVNVAYAGSTLGATTIYVRLKAGLAAGNYNSENVVNSGGSATSQNVACSGTVYSSSLTRNPASVSGMSYVFGAGPSSSATYSLSGTYLTPAAGNITVTAPTNYEVSSDNTNFFNSINLAYNSNTLASTTVYVRLKSGLAIAAYNGEIIQNSGGGATTVNVTCNGEVTDPSLSPTTFTAGDIAVLGVNSNLICLSGYSNGDDEISFVAFKAINPGTKFYMTDNGYERLTALEWGNSEGVLEATRTGGQIPAGTVITFRFKNGGTYEAISPDANWTITEVHTYGTDLIMNANGDQIFFMQGGVWDYGTGAGSHDATYTPGIYLFAFNTNSTWTSLGGSTQHSALIPFLQCFSMMPGGASDFLKYTGDLSAANKRTWIDRINTPANWTSVAGADATAKCNNYYTTAPDYTSGYSITLAPGGFNAGIWTGVKSVDWFDCENWQNMIVPDETINVSIPNSGVTNNPTVGAPPTTPVPYTSAECNNITVGIGRTLTVNNASSIMDIYGNLTNDGAISHTNGSIHIRGNGSSTISGNSIVFHDLYMDKGSVANSVSLSTPVSVSNYLYLNTGILATGTNRVTVTNTGTDRIQNSSINSYINGNLRRNVSSVGTYTFPVGTATQYELATVTLNSSAGMTYIDASFTNPHSTPIDITALGLIINTSLVSTLLDYGFWTIAPDAYSSVNYDISLVSRGHTNGGTAPDQHTVVKRTNSSSNWALEGTHNNATQSGTGASPITAVRTSLTAFSDFAIARSSLFPLPVELTSFSAKCDNGGIMLEWTTASEANNDFFFIEQSVDGTNFSEIAKVPGAGTSFIPSTYQYKDDSFSDGIVYYRLGQQDYDGKQTIWSVISTRCFRNNSSLNLIYLDEQEYLNIEFNQEFQKGIVYILDMNGKNVYEQSLNTNPGRMSLSLHELCPGIYLFRVSENGKETTHKLLIP